MRKAFTLIELLVVIAIIAILAAILFPVFAQAKEAAKKTADLSNQKNICTSVNLYGADSDDTFPRTEYKVPGRMAAAGWNAPITWRDALMPYIKNGQVVQNGVTLAVNGIFETPAKPGVRNGYGFNRILSPGRCYWNGSGGGWVCDHDDNGVRNPAVPVFASVSMTALDAPAQIATTIPQGINPDWGAGGDYFEGSWWWFGGAQWPPIFTGPGSHEKWDCDSNVSPCWSMARYRYSQGMNTGFADGHAKFVRKGAFNWCKFMYVKGLSTDYAGASMESWDWIFDTSWNAPCSAFAR